MPQTKKEGIIFTITMCFLMVLGMSTYNLILHNAFSVNNLLMGLIPGFITAFILDTCVVGVIAKKIAFSLNLTNKLQLILVISSLMVLGMVSLMSIFGIVMEQGPANIISAYPHTWLMNFIVALPYQLLVVGPISRFLLTLIQTKPVGVKE